MFKDPNTGTPVASPTLKNIEEELSNFKHITKVPTACGYDLLIREKKDPQTGKGYIITEGGDPTEISPRVAVDNPNSVAIVVKQITHWAKWYNVLQISNHNPDLDIDFKLRPHGTSKDRGSLIDKEIDLSLLEGDQFSIQVTNRSHRDVYIALLDLSTNGSVDLVFPKGGEQEFMEQGKTLEKAENHFTNREKLDP